jgi:glycine/D-amino acid oxidase-like deaminating enzyme
VVVATGAWSKPFATQLGDAVCLDTERGYHLSFGSTGTALLNRPVCSLSISSPHCRHLVYAFGHGHLGLTRAAVTAQTVAGIVGERALPLDIRPYGIDRF